MKLDLNTIRENTLSIDFLAKKLVEGFITGLHKSPYHGFSVEFAEHRNYNVGESTRYIDWKVYAKTDRLFTKTFEEETNLRCHILIDVSNSMWYPKNKISKLYFGVYSAAALIWLLFKQRDAVSITTFSSSIKEQTAVKSSISHIQKLFGLLDNTLKSKPDIDSTNLAEVIHEISNTIHKRSLVVIFSDMINTSDDEKEFTEALMHLKHNKHEIIIFHIKDKKTEVDFDFKEVPHLFVDLESGERVKLRPSEIKDQYKKLSKARTEKLKVLCGELKIDLIEVDTAEDIDSVLNTFLIKRSKMR
ncbi:MAG: DUF58 domain-containing protein [Cyclobacteriaceae bacterium]|nr:DUF58 domain-containing protein [Cyclobacteriaceae bacterium]